MRGFFMAMDGRYAGPPVLPAPADLTFAARVVCSKLASTSAGLVARWGRIMRVNNRVLGGNPALFLAVLLVSSAANAATCNQQVLDGARTLAAEDPGNYDIYEVDAAQDTDLGYGSSLPDIISFEFYSLNNPLASGTFDLASGINSNYETCDQCLLVYSDIDVLGSGVPQKTFFQTGGTLVVDAMTPPGSDPITMSWQNVTLAEVTIDPNTFHSTLVPNGECFTIVPDKIFANDFE
jgi:hypothetical protein